jgi:hypothetical protein
MPAVADGLPSGQALVLWQVLWERVEGQGTQAIFRFIAPSIARETGEVDFDAAQADMQWLCETHGAPILALPAARADSVVISLMDRPVPRGVADRDATQFFSAYRVEDGECFLEDF